MFHYPNITPISLQLVISSGLAQLSEDACFQALFGNASLQ